MVSNRVCALSVVSALAVILSCLAPVDHSPANAATAADDTIKVGFVTSLSGVAATNGLTMVNGFKLLMDQINSTIAGKKVQVFVENDESDPATAMSKMHKLVNQDKVDVVAGFILNPINFAAANAADQLHVPTVLAIAQDSPDLHKHHQWTVRTTASPCQMTLPFGDWVYRKLGYKKIAVLSVDYSLGWEVVGAFQKSFEDAGGKIIQKVWVPLGVTTYEDRIKMISKDADAVFMIATGGAAKVMPKQFRDQFKTMPVVAFGSTFDEAVLPEQGDAAVGSIHNFLYATAIDTPDNHKFVDQYRKKYGTAPGAYALGGYTSGELIRNAIEALHGDVSNKEKLLATLKATPIEDDPRGPISHDAGGNPIQNIYVRKVERVHGALQNTVVSTFNQVKPYWKYNADDIASPPSRNVPACKYCIDTH